MYYKVFIEHTNSFNMLDIYSCTGSGVRRIEKAKVAVIQFCLSAPKTDMDNSVVLQDYTQMDKVSFVFSKHNIIRFRVFFLTIKSFKQSNLSIIKIFQSLLFSFQN